MKINIFFNWEVLKLFYEFSRMARELGHRGWRLEEEGNRFYISKFDERYNEDEFRFYVKSINSKIHIVHKEKLKASDRPMPIRENNQYFKIAKILCHEFEKKYVQHLKNIS